PLLEGERRFPGPHEGARLEDRRVEHELADLALGEDHLRLDLAFFVDLQVLEADGRLSEEAGRHLLGDPAGERGREPDHDVAAGRALEALLAALHHQLLELLPERLAQRGEPLDLPRRRGRRRGREEPEVEPCGAAAEDEQDEEPGEEALHGVSALASLACQVPATALTRSHNRSLTGSTCERPSCRGRRPAPTRTGPSLIPPKSTEFSRRTGISRAGMRFSTCSRFARTASSMIFLPTSPANDSTTRKCMMETRARSRPFSSRTF